MRRFIIKIILIFFPIFLSGIFLEFLLRTIPNDYKFKKEYLDKNASAIETLILGSSHSYFGLNPDYFSSKTFNASHVSQSLNYDLEIVRKYQDKFQNLKTIILPISYFSLFGKLEESSESWRLKSYNIYYGMYSSISLMDYSEVLSNRFDVNIERIVSYYKHGDSALSCSKLGWGLTYNSKNAKNLIETAKTAAKRHTKDNINSEESQKTFNENILILNAIIQWCEKNNVNVMFLTLPAFETYRHELNHEQLQITINTISEICSKHENCIYENLLSDPNFVATDFYDADHLSEIGAKKISILINERINKWK